MARGDLSSSSAASASHRVDPGAPRKSRGSGGARRESVQYVKEVTSNDSMDTTCEDAPEELVFVRAHPDVDGEERAFHDKVYKKCSVAGLAPRWSAEGEALRVAPGNINYFVCAVFDGAEFEHLMACKVKVVSSFLVAECLRQETCLPRIDHPKWSMHMDGAVVCFTQIPSDRRSELRRLVQFMNGQVSGDLFDGVTHVVGERCDTGSDKYTEGRRLKLPFLSPDWVEAAWKDARTRSSRSWLDRKTMDRFKVALFKDMFISVSGVARDQRSELSRAIELHGGRFTGEMKRDVCTHLVTDKNSGEKFRKAREWGYDSVRIVQCRWVRKCIEAGYVLPETAFDPEKNRSSTPTKDGKAVPELDVSHIPGMGGRLNNTTLNTQMNVSLASVSGVGVGGGGGAAAATPTAAPVGAAGGGGGGHRRSDGDVLGSTTTTSCVDQTVSMARTPATAHRPSLSRHASSRRRLDGGGETGEEAAAADPIEQMAEVEVVVEEELMEGLRIWLFGVADANLDAWKRWINRVGATRVTRCEQATHVLVLGSGAAEKQTLVGACERGATVVSVDWFTTSVKQNRMCGTEEYAWKEEAAAATGGGTPLLTTFTRRESFGRSGGGGRASGARGGGERQLDMDGNTRRESVGRAGGGTPRLLGSTSFFGGGGGVERTPVARKVISVDGDGAAAGVCRSTSELDSRMLRTAGGGGGGGEESSSGDMPPVLVGVRLRVSEYMEGEGDMECAVVCGQLGATVVTTGATHCLYESTQLPEEMTGDEQPVTWCWVFSCIRQKQPLPVGSHPLYRPLPVERKQSDIFAGMVITITGFEQEEKEVLIGIVRAHGARSQDAISRRGTDTLMPTSHVVVGARNERYEKVKTWGVACVCGEWVVRCAMAGRALPTQRFPVGKLLSEVVRDDAVWMAGERVEKEQEEEREAAGGGGGAEEMEETAPPVTEMEEDDSFNDSVVFQPSTRLTSNQSDALSKTKSTATPVNKRLSALRSMPISSTPVRGGDGGGASGGGASPAPGTPMDTPSKFLDPNRPFTGRFRLDAAERFIDEMASPSQHDATSDSLSTSMVGRIMNEAAVKTGLLSIHTPKTAREDVEMESARRPEREPQQGEDEKVEVEQGDEAASVDCGLSASQESRRNAFLLDRQKYHRERREREAQEAQEEEEAARAAAAAAAAATAAATQPAAGRKRGRSDTEGPTAKRAATTAAAEGGVSGVSSMESPPQPPRRIEWREETIASPAPRPANSRSAAMFDLSQSPEREAAETAAAAAADTVPPVKSQELLTPVALSRRRTEPAPIGKENVASPGGSALRPTRSTRTLLRAEEERRMSQRRRSREQEKEKEQSVVEVEAAAEKLLADKVASVVAVAEQKRRFMYTGYVSEERAAFTEMILKLGGEVFEGNEFDTTATHLVCGRVLRNERVLGAIAHSLWVVDGEYVRESAAAGAWKQEDGYEWGGPRCGRMAECGDKEKKIAVACRRSRMAGERSRKNGKGEKPEPKFSSWRAIIYTKEHKHKSICSLIRTGGGVAVWKGECSDTAKFAPTHAFVDANNPPGWSKKELALCVSLGTKAYQLEYIANSLIDEPVDEQAGMLPEYKEWCRPYRVQCREMNK